MKIYYYAFSGHRWGLDRVKRGVALIKSLREKGIVVQLLVNDFRAGLVAKELGVGEAMTMETIMDIDMIANEEDIIFIDTSESENGRIERYTKEYKKLFHIVDSCDSLSRYGEVVISPLNSEFSSIIIDKEYFNSFKKVNRRVFFLSDADYNKTILSHKDFFKESNMELILGNYFFVKYEDELSKLFSRLHEPEEYKELICTSSEVITASMQCALEARASDAKVVYIKQKDDALCLLDKLKSFGINIIDGFNNIDLASIINNPIKENKKVTTNIDITTQNIMNIINL